jgi:hypothetical protein
MQPLRTPAVLLLAAVTFTSCVVTPRRTVAAATEPIPPRFTRTFDASLRSNPAARAAWAAYCDVLQRDRERFSRVDPASRWRPSFAVELAARESLVVAYLGQRVAAGERSSSDDAYLDDLAAVRGAGYLAQYVFFELDPGTWAAPPGLSDNGYRAWMAARMPSHVPLALATVRPSRTDESGGDLDAVMPRWSRKERLMVELSFIALAGFWHAEEPRTVDAVRGLMSRMLPRQELVWGPAAHQPGFAQATDALELVCRDLDTGEYTVVFRGTNPVSTAEWLLQDFSIQRRVPWREIQAGSAPDDAVVSEGTATAIAIRSAMRPLEGAPGEGRALGDALEAILEESRGPCVIHFTGHSLGGLMASTMALRLLDRLETEGRTDLLSRLRPDVVAIASPTTGNAAFNRYLASRVRTRVLIANPLDVVPHAWDESTLEDLPGLYKPLVSMEPFMSSLYDWGVRMARGAGYAREPGAVPVASRVVPVRGGLYLLEAIYQHSVPYLDMLLPDREETILDEVLRPLSGFVTEEGVQPLDVGSLFTAGSSRATGAATLP